MDYKKPLRYVSEKSRFHYSDMSVGALTFLDTLKGEQYSWKTEPTTTPVSPVRSRT